MKKQWDNIFDEPSGKRGWSICVLISFIIIIIIILLKLHFPSWFGNPVIVTVFDTVIAIITGVISASILNIFYKAYASRKLKQIKSISYDGLLIDFFEVLSTLKGKYRKDEHIELQFLEYRTDDNELVKDLYKIKIQYKFKTKLRNPFFQCFVARGNKKADSDDISEYTTGMSEKLHKYEFYWKNDETNFINKKLIDDSSYRIYNAFIDDNAIPNEEIKVDKLDKDDGKELEYTLSLPKGININLKKEHTIRFTVSFPMERESILFLTHEYPAKDIEVTIDNTFVSDRMELYAIPVTGAIKVKSSSSIEDEKIFFSHSGWMLPKSGYIVAWWDLNEKSEHMEEEDDTEMHKSIGGE